MRIGIFDLETREWANDVPAGFSNIQAFGMSVGVVNDVVYWQDEIEKLLMHLRACDLIVGFNLIDFDYKVLEGYRPHFDYGSLPTFDILADFKHRHGHRVSLDSLCEKTLDEKKSGTGQQAVQWWREKKLGKLVEYCKRDVRLTKYLFEHGLKKRHLCYKDDESVTGQRIVRTDHWDDTVMLATKTSPLDAVHGALTMEDVWTGLTQLSL